jgi:hypothetical protein
MIRKELDDMTKRARTQTACRVARVDRQMFNEITMRNQYHCAPKAEPGTGRVFELDDMAALYVFGKLVREGMSREAAGAWACSFLEALRKRAHNNAIAVVRVSFPNGAAHWVLIPNDEKAEHIVRLSNPHPVEDQRRFDFDLILDHIRKALDDEQSIIGTEE